MISIVGVTKSYGSIKALGGLTLEIPSGQIFGYLGPNGAGKTTTVKILSGMIPPDSGTARIAGFDITRHALEVKKRIGVVPESGALYESLTPAEYWEFAGRLYHLDQQTISRRGQEFAELFGLKDRIAERMNGFSKGMKQRVVIASALLHNPDVVFLDEPLNGLDANAVLIVKELIRSLAKKGKTVFYCSHILEVVEKLCDRVVILDSGVVAADGSVASLKRMTRRTSLEAVFSKLTQDPEAKDAARVLAEKLAGEKQKP
ncbi:ABC transporter ATP-binding protein [bacterium]|nr:ABC transporter ATP-binding protein [bacterium]